MSGNDLTIFTVPQACQTTLHQVEDTLRSAGYTVLQSFDLQTAMGNRTPCACGKQPCTCQMAVLLVYAQDGPPATLIFDRNPSKTSLALVSKPLPFDTSSWIGDLKDLFTDSTNPRDLTDTPRDSP